VCNLRPLLMVIAGLLLAGALYAQEEPAQGSRKRIFAPGALLDDYEAAEPGSVTVSLGGGYYKVLAGYDVAMPWADITIGLTRRISLSANSSFSRSVFELFRTNAVGDAYVNAKFVLLAEGRRRPGVAFEPVLEILGRPSLANNLLAPDKYNAAFGGILGKNLWDTFRVYSHSGYFTRGIVFTSAAVEFTRLSRLTPVAYASFGALSRHRDAVAEAQLNASRPDVGGTLGFRLARDWTGFVSLSRSLGRRDLNSISISVSGGVSYTWRPRR